MSISELNHALFRNCPRCAASPLRLRPENAYGCDACGLQFFLNSAAAVAALIIDPGCNLLVTIRKNPPAPGTWDLPGGFVAPDETAEDALRREIKEEVNLEITHMHYVCSFPNRYRFEEILYATLDLAFRCEVREWGGIRAGDDVADFQWVPLNAIDGSRFGLPSIRRIVEHFISFWPPAESRPPVRP